MADIAAASPLRAMAGGDGGGGGEGEGGGGGGGGDGIPNGPATAWARSRCTDRSTG